MDDIRLIETDGDYLVVEANGGQKFRLLIDDSVRSAVKREAPQALDDLTMTPRQIQDAVRVGTTIDELVKLSGATWAFVEKFAAPVIAELEHIIESALSVRVTTAGDRYTATHQIEFGELVANRLAASGASDITWIARRSETGGWHVSVAYKINGTEAVATWAFDQRALALSPENEAAISLSAHEEIGSIPIPKLRPVDASTSEAVTEVIPSTPAAFAHLVPKVEEPAAQVEVEAPIAPVVSITPIVQPAPVAAAKPVADVTPSEPLSATADLLEALRRKRTEREESEAKVAVEDTQVIEPVKAAEPAPVVSEPVAETPAEAPASAPAKKGRASMPSWDEIVFGTKADD
ncbi:septation protein SepH [Rhodoluna sp.]|uniref:septation protein SepH n=1 Tax=Rhodoluna sp. TaxID=1969481 RepID=UPI0025E47071|nr:septation protein SepH [Rhodoluna sp.]